MNKQRFLAQMRKALSGLPKKDIEEYLIFYGEMIDDRMEEGLSEEEAVLAVGSVDEIAAQVVAEKNAKKRMQPKHRPRVLIILLLLLGSPIWISLGIAAAAIIFSLCVSLWAIVISLWAVFASLAIGVLGGIAAGIIFVCCGHVLSGIVMMSAGIVCAGLSIFAFYGCKMVTKGILIFTKKPALWMKKCLIKREEAQ